MSQGPLPDLNAIGSSIGGDSSACDREQIQIPGSIQPHGILFTLRQNDLTVLQFSANAPDSLRIEADQLRGRSIDELLSPPIVKTLRDALAAKAAMRSPMYLGRYVATPTVASASFAVTAHISSGVVVVEMEPFASETPTTFESLYALIRDFVSNLQHATTLTHLAALASAEVQKITGFDRVLVYQFDEEWNGTVIGEALDPEAYALYMDLRFPASDIPRQARELYRVNRLRLIVDSNYRPVPLIPPMNPLDGRPLDLSFAALRSVSPVHVEYLRNMNAMASMSISILRQGELWGLIACHHRQVLTLPFEVRTACDFIGQVLSVQVETRQLATESREREQMRSLQAMMLSSIVEESNVRRGLLANEAEMLQFAAASGAAIVVENAITLVGRTPTREQCASLIDWLALSVDADQDVWSTDALPEVFPESSEYMAVAAGVLAIRISKLHRSFVLWFRPELQQNVKWGGDPRKIVTYLDGVERLHPRKSFEIWKETVRGRSLRWTRAQREAALELRNAIVGIVLRKAEELAALSAELEASNQELEAFSYTVSHDLRAPFRHIVGYAELLKSSFLEGTLNAEQLRYLETIMESGKYAGKLVDNLLSFSRMGRSSLNVAEVEMNELARTVRLELNEEHPDRRLEWRIANLPKVRGDRLMLRLVVRNLLENAVKYSRNASQPVIEFGLMPQESSPGGSPQHLFFVRDNGVGFDMTYADKLFGVFQRLHRMEDYEGTGIGLANVRRIVERHGGRTWAKSTPGEGATFYFTLPGIYISGDF